MINSRTKKKKPKTKGRPSDINSYLARLEEVGVFRIADARRLKISQSTLSRLVQSGSLLRLGTGLYLHPDSKIPPEERDYALACSKFGPRSVVGGMSALFHYGLIEQVPQRIWIMVPQQIKTTDRLYRCIRTQTDSSCGTEDHGHYRITNLERSLVEAFRYSSKIGLRIALRATRTALVEKKTTLQKIIQQAKALGLEKFVKKHWEAIIPEGQAT